MNRTEVAMVRLLILLALSCTVKPTHKNVQDRQRLQYGLTEEEHQKLDEIVGVEERQRRCIVDHVTKLRKQPNCVPNHLNSCWYYMPRYAAAKLCNKKHVYRRY